MDALVATWFVPDPTSDSASSSFHAVPATFDAPNVAAERALLAWAEARGIKLARAPRDTLPALPIDPAIADAVEKDLVLARDALTRLDADATEHALIHARALLHDHPEIHQAAWLLAEVERGWAGRWMRISPPDSERAARAWQRAAALDGGRAAGIGETAVPKLAEVTVTFSADEDRATEILVDGVSISMGETKLSPGEHAIVSKRRDRVSWAGWVSVADRQIVRVPAFHPQKCSADDLSLARMDAENKPIDASGVACGEWIAASMSGPSTLRVSLCEGEHCGPWVLWQSHASSRAPVLPSGERKHKTSAWLVVGAAVLAAVMITGVTLVAAGAFDAAPHETKLVGGGVKTSSFPIIP